MNVWSLRDAIVFYGNPLSSGFESNNIVDRLPQSGVIGFDDYGWLKPTMPTPSRSSGPNPRSIKNASNLVSPINDSGY
jgi:hypothetical protein